MSQSLNEIEALAKKATRGAGRAWGIAEEAGKATRWLESFGLPGGSALADLLDATDGVAADTVSPVRLASPWSAPSGLLCPLAAGATLSDFSDHLTEGSALELQGLSHPILIVPFAAWAAAHLGKPIRLRWHSISVETDGFGVSLQDTQGRITAPDQVAVTCQISTSGQATMTLPGERGQIEPSARDRLSRLAGRTYAPATEESRALGAGAGASDND